MHGCIFYTQQIEHHICKYKREITKVVNYEITQSDANIVFPTALCLIIHLP